MKLQAGSIYRSNNYGNFVIVEDRGCSKVDIRFAKTGCAATTQRSHILRGRVKDPLCPSVCGVGFTGAGRHKANIGGKNTKPYAVWHSMLERCYSAKRQTKYPAYKNCTVDPEWHDFQSFADWFEDNYAEGLHLDKDIRVPGNKVYSPGTCLFVTSAANTIEAHAKKYKLRSPDGNVVEIYNMSEFARDTDLHQSALSAVHSGKIGHHKGWTRA